MDAALLKEIAPGLVLHLDPGVLLGVGGKASGPAHTWVNGPHFFLCVDASGKRPRWVPLFTNDGEGRQPISTDGRTGHPKWTGGTFHYHTGQVWTASREAIARAADAGGDQSTAGQRNKLDASKVPAV